MKTHSSKMRLHTLRISFLIMILLASIMGKTQNVGRLEMYVTDDVMNSGVGIVGLRVDENYLNEITISWQYDDMITHEHLQFQDVTRITGLHPGMIAVYVYSKRCNVLIFEDYKYIQNNDSVFSAFIKVTSNSETCSQAFAHLSVIVSGGEPPYTYEWGEPYMNVSTPGTYSCKVTDSNNNTCEAETYVSMKTIECSTDPNEIVGPEGYGEDKMISATAKMPYSISFENDPDFATAPASKVIIDYPIPDKQKLSSFRLGDFGFGSFVFTVPNNTASYYQRLDVSDSLGVWVDITAGIDIANNKAFWIFQSIDPATGFEPQDAQQGFLPVNDSFRRGEGHVNFYLSPKDNVQTGDTTNAAASIVFDENAPIMTNVWTNKFDAVAPTSNIMSCELVENDSTLCAITFSAQDDMNGSGVNTVELLVSENGGQYVSAGSYNIDAVANYTIMPGSYYEFISIATDYVGNTESFKTIPDAVINNGTAPTDIALSNYSFYEYDAVGSTVGELSTVDIGDIFVYQLVPGSGANDNDLFAISGNKLVTNVDFNCSDRLEYSVRVRSTDASNLYVERAFDISMVKTNSDYDLNYEGDVCYGDNFVGYGWNINLTDSLPGTYTYVKNLQTIRGCDSIRTLTLRVHPAYNIALTDEIIEGESYFEHGFNIENPAVGILYDTLHLTTTNGCDSIVTLSLTVNPLPYMTQSYSLVSGWNWWSTFIEQDGIDGLEMLENSLGSNGVLIKSQTAIVDNYYSSIGYNYWFGNLTALDNESRFLINVVDNSNVQMTGQRANTSSHPITIMHNWNWIGYPVNVEQSVNVALGSFPANGDDIIKSQDASSVYFEGYGWYPNFNLNPGQGYLYLSKDNANKTLTYDINRTVAPDVCDKDYLWVSNRHAYADNLTVIAAVYVNDERIASEDFEIGAFVGDERRGSVKMKYFEPYNCYYAVLTVSGEDGDDISFGMINNHNYLTNFNSPNHLVFETNAVLGSINNPYVLQFITDKDEYLHVGLYPNPVDRDEMFHLAVPDDEIVSELLITDILGSVVRHDYGDNKAILGISTSGVYDVKVHTKSGKIYHGRLIVK